MPQTGMSDTRVALQSIDTSFALLHLCVTAKFMFKGLLKSNFKPSNKSGLSVTAAKTVILEIAELQVDLSLRKSGVKE